MRLARDAPSGRPPTEWPLPGGRALPRLNSTPGGVVNATTLARFHCVVGRAGSEGAGGQELDCAFADVDTGVVADEMAEIADLRGGSDHRRVPGAC